MSEFVNTVDIIGDDALCDRIITRTLTEYSDSHVKTIGDYAMQGCTSLTTINFPNVTIVDMFAFYGCSALKTANLPIAEELRGYCFYKNSKLESINIPLVVDVGKQTFGECAALSKIQLASTKSIGELAFMSCTGLTALILHSTTVCKLENVNAFQDSSISAGTGYIYVPSALVNEYKSATNWSVFADRIRAIESYPGVVGG